MSRWILVGFLCFFFTLDGLAASRTWHLLPTGNGHGFQIFDRQEGRITSFLEHPYRFVAPGDESRTWGVGRRDLAHDIYFGLTVDDGAIWLTSPDEMGYEEESHIIRAAETISGVEATSYFFSPFGYEGNALVMLIRVSNKSSSTKEVGAFAKPNLKLGSGRVDPNDVGEEIQWKGDGSPAHWVETGPGGGHAIYLPIGEPDERECGNDSVLYQNLLAGDVFDGNTSCSGQGQVLVAGKNWVLEPGESAWWGMAVLFVNDNPNDSQAADFKDHRSVDDVLALWTAFRGDSDAEQLHAHALEELEEWRVDKAPEASTDEEKTLWRMSETVLRMGQVREALQDNRENFGMILAALPPGEWHTGWVRDGVYAIVAMAMTGHTEEAKLGVEFMLGADGDTHGFFKGPDYLDMTYRISACRYFGNGKEEGDFNAQGPNVETDGWGLVLWGARMALHYSCDLSWLDKETWKGDTVFEALHEIAENIEDYLLPASALPGADASIWEVHWLLRRTFSFTAACQIRGLFDFADIAEAYGRNDLADHYRVVAQEMLDASKQFLVYQPQNSFASHLGVSGSPVHVDGSTVEFFTWGLVGPEDPLMMGTLTQYAKLITGFGGYRRLEPQLSLTGESSANEYDLSEWIVLDLRIGDAWRMMGEVEKGDAQFHKITDAAVANDFLVPELFDPNNGSYAGVVPMVGYGAGAWMMSQLDRHGHPTPRYDVGFGHCDGVEPPTEEGGEEGGDETGEEAGEQAGETPEDTDVISSDPEEEGGEGEGGSNNPGPPSEEEGEGVDPWDDGPASACHASSSLPQQGGWLLMLWLLLCGVRRVQHGA